CLRYVVSPMCPGRTLEKMAGTTRLELATSAVTEPNRLLLKQLSAAQLVRWLIFSCSRLASFADRASVCIAPLWRGRDLRNLAASSGTNPPCRPATPGVRRGLLKSAHRYSVLPATLVFEELCVIRTG